MSSLCGANCNECSFKEKCKGCSETCGSPLGGSCVAAKYIQFGGMDAYLDFKKVLIKEINESLKMLGIPEVDELFELVGEFVNLPYNLPSGQSIKMLKDNDIYLGSQIEVPDLGICYGVVANMEFILVCSYSVNGTEPELIMYKHR